MKYKVNETYAPDPGCSYRIMATSVNQICYMNVKTCKMFVSDVDDCYLGNLTRDSDGNLVEPDPPEDKYKVGEWYDDCDLREIVGLYGEKVVYWNHTTQKAGHCHVSASLGDRIKDEHGNPVEAEPGPPEDKLYPVEVRKNGARVKMPDSIKPHGARHSIGVGHVIGRPDGEGRICIGFVSVEGQYPSAGPTFPSTPESGKTKVNFHRFAIFRHHSLINQEPDE